MSRKKSQIGIVLLGILVIFTIMLLQMKWNILNMNFTFVFLVNYIWAAICCIYFRMYKTQEDDYMIEKNKTLLLYGLGVGIFTVTGILSEIRYAYVANTWVIYFTLIYMLVYYVSSILLFFINAKSNIYRYVILVEFVGLYLISVSIS